MNRSTFAVCSKELASPSLNPRMCDIGACCLARRLFCSAHDNMSVAHQRSVLASNGRFIAASPFVACKWDDGIRPRTGILCIHGGPWPLVASRRELTARSDERSPGDYPVAHRGVRSRSHGRAFQPRASTGAKLAPLSDATWRRLAASSRPATVSSPLRLSFANLAGRFTAVDCGPVRPATTRGVCRKRRDADVCLVRPFHRLGSSALIASASSRRALLLRG